MKLEQPTLDFAIIGAQKSATTTLLKILREDQNIWMPNEESRLFEEPYYSVSEVDEFLSKLPSGGLLKGIKRPDLLADSNGIARLLDHCPEIKLVVVLRDPIARALSAYYHYIRYASLPVVGHEKGFEAIFSREWDQKWPLNQKVLEYGSYGKYLSKLLRVLPREQVGIFWHDEFVSNPSKAVQEVKSFLGQGLGSSGEDFSRSRHSQKTVYSLTRLKFLRLRNSLCVKWDTTRQYGDLRFGVFSKLVWFGFDAIDRFILGPMFGNCKSVVSRELYEQLRAYYQDDVELLSRLVELPSSWQETYFRRNN